MVVAVAPLRQQAKQPEISLSDDGLQLDLHLSLRLGISAKQAKRKLSRFLLDEVSLFIGPEDPLLVLTAGSSAVWRFPVEFSMAKQGRVGQVGTIDIDTQTGDLLVTEEQLLEIKSNARLLAGSTTLPANT
jgi:hypothetical protein